MLNRRINRYDIYCNLKSRGDSPVPIEILSFHDGSHAFLQIDNWCYRMYSCAFNLINQKKFDLMAASTMYICLNNNYLRYNYGSRVVANESYVNFGIVFHDVVKAENIVEFIMNTQYYHKERYGGMLVRVNLDGGGIYTREDSQNAIHSEKYGQGIFIDEVLKQSIFGWLDE